MVNCWHCNGTGQMRTGSKDKTHRNRCGHCHGSGIESKQKMNIGPCLCGDPYCPYCGDPGAAAMEEWILGIENLAMEKRFTEIEARLFQKTGIAAVEAYREEMRGKTAP